MSQTNQTFRDHTHTTSSCIHFMKEGSRPQELMMAFQPLKVYATTQFSKFLTLICALYFRISQKAVSLALPVIQGSKTTHL